MIGVTMQEEMRIARRLRDYWDVYPSKVRVDGLEPGSSEYLVAIERHHDASFASCDALIDFESLRDLTVVDIYCGVGIDAIAAARQGARAISVATARQHAQLTQRFARQQDIRLDVVVADPDRLPFIDGAFDLVLARGVLMFTPEVERAIEELYRVAKPGGRLAALMLNRWSWYPLLARLSGKQLIQEPEDPPYLRLDSAARARKLFTGLRELQLVIDRFPRRTAERGGISTLLFNLGVVPLFKLLPDWLVRPFGFYLIISGRKP